MDLGRKRPIPVDIINKTVKSVCKIIIYNKPKNIYGDGFFMKIYDSEENFLTNNHSINQDPFKKRYWNRITQQKKKEIKFKQLFYQIYFIS